jgi:hypothetical protein
MMDNLSDYIQFRGRCKELSEAACKADPTLRLVRGHYFCPIYNTDEPHWWCVRADGTIEDPSKQQFPSNGFGIYTEFTGIIACAECGNESPEAECRIEGRYGFCSTACALRFVGL